MLWHVRENPEETRTLRLWPLIRSLSDFVVVNCDDSRRRLLPSAGSTPVASVANGLDEEFFFANRSASRPLRERFDIPENAQMVGTVGHVKSRKGTFVFVRAAARVLQRRKDARFLICGRAATGRGRDARYFQAIEEFVNSNALEDRILFLGEHGHMASVYQELDVVALPSQWDATSRVLLEAMACERPVVATQTGGLPEVLDDGAAGRLVAVDDEVDLAEKILELLESPETAGKLAKAGRQRFEQHYTIDRHVDSMVEVYRGILA